MKDAVFMENQDTLLVTFETHQRIAESSDAGEPLGWDLSRALGWSHLCLLSDGDTWFREPQVYGFFDRLVDEGFFDDFERVIFYGAGACGYAAAAFSVAAPGAQVVVLRPQATLDPRVAEWDHRFTHMRRTAFDDRYGYAPDMLDAADRAFVIYDPEEELDAMHAALFTRSNVTKFRMRFMGADLENALMQMNLLYRIIAQASAGKLTRLALSRLFRARRNTVPYLKRLLARLENDERYYLVGLMTNRVMQRTPGPRFRKAQNAAYRIAQERNIKMPPRPSG